MRILWFLTVFTIGSLLLTNVAYGQANSNQNLKFGAVLPLTGVSALTGVDIKRGFELALSEASCLQNCLEIIFEDSESNVSKAVSAAQKLINHDKVDIIFSLWDAADPIAPLAEKYGLVHLPIRWNNDLAQKFNNTFTFESTYKSYSLAFLKLLQEQGLKKVAILNQDAEGWNLGLAVLEKYAPEYGLEITSSFTYLANQNNYQSLVIRALKDKPDAILVNDFGSNLELIARKVKEQNADVIITGYLDEPINYHLFEGVKFVAQLDLTPAFSVKFLKAFNTPVQSRAQLAYDMIKILELSLSNFTAKPTTNELINALKQIKNFQGASGTISNQSGKTFETEVLIKQIVNGVAVSVNNQ